MCWAAQAPQPGTHTQPSRWTQEADGKAATTTSIPQQQHPATKAQGKAAETAALPAQLCSAEGKLWHHAWSPKEPTRDVGGDLGEGCLAKALASAGPDGEEVGGARVEVGEDMVGLVAQLGDRAPRAGHVDRRVGGLDALVADLQGQGRASPAATGEGREPGSEQGRG